MITLAAIFLLIMCSTVLIIKLFTLNNDLTDNDREGILKFIFGDEERCCDLCGEIVTPQTLSGWDEDGHAQCTIHGPLVMRYDD